LKRVPSPLRGSFRGVAIAITLVSVITFSTIGYSVYRAYQWITASGGLKGITATPVINGTKVAFALNGSIPNNGLYPIDLSFSISAESGGQLLTKSTSTAVKLLPGQNRAVNFTSQIDLLSLTNVTNPQRFLLNDSTISLFTTINAGLEPFASMSMGIPGGNITLPPLMGNFKVGTATVTNQGVQSLVALPISFVNKANHPYPFSMSADLSAGQSVLGRSQSFNGTSIPGQPTSFVLSLTVPTAQLKAGTYQLNLQAVLLSNKIPIRLTVRVP
jgi:hypothetical protein